MAGGAAASLIATLLVGAGGPPAHAAVGDPITGTIWQDYDANGVFDTYESGLASIEVYAYDAEGNVAGPVLTGPDGTYELPVASDAARWRVEANLPDTAQWAQWRDSVVGRGGDPANGTTVQFVDVIDGTGASGVDFSFQVPSAYVENNPQVYLPVYRYGASDGAQADLFGGAAHLYDAVSSANTPVPMTLQVPFRQIGATFGTAWQQSGASDEDGQLFAAAYVRRHAGLGPEGIGAVYRIVPDDGTLESPTASAELLVDVTDFGIDLGSDSLPGADPTDPNGLRPVVSADNPAYDWRRDSQAWYTTGRAGLGGMEISNDQRYLIAVNLHERSLIRIEIDRDGAGVLGVEEFELDSYFPDDSDLRPYGVSSNPITNEMYLTVTDTAESTGDSSDLRGIVYSFSVDNPGELREVLEFPLGYDRGRTYSGNGSSSYKPWSTDPADYASFYNGDLMQSAVPIVTDARYLHGELVVGIRDLGGDIFGGYTYLSPNPGDNRTQRIRSVGGEMLMAAPTGDGTWTIEQNGVVDGRSGAGAGAGSFLNGPSGPDKFFTDTWNQPPEHLGAVLVVPSRPDGILETGLHVGLDGFQVGTRRFTQENGATVSGRGAIVITGTNQIGVTVKGNGLGELTALASSAPIEIGNYVWYDIDNDGIQDPDEPPVEGATVNLYEVDGEGNRTLVSTTTTDANGEYYFSSNPELNENGYALQTNTDYVVGIDNPDDYAAGGPLENWYPTIPDTGDPDSIDPDRNDSDGLVEETPEGFFPYAAITTGGPGENDHTIDFGYSNIDYEFDKRTVSGPTENPDDDGTWVLEYELVAENTGMIDGSYGLTDDLTGYGDGIVVVDTEVVSGPAGAALNPDWDGVDDQRIITADQPIAAQSTQDNGTEHVYLIRVTVALATDAGTGEAAVEPGQLACTDGQAPGDATTGLFNVATMDPNNHEDLVDQECGSLPLVTLDKTITVEPHVVDPVTNPGEYEISYGLTVTNETTTATDYDLEDRLRFGEGITIVDGSVSSQNETPGGIATNPSYDGVSDSFIVTDEPIGPSEVHTYTVTVRYTVELPEAGSVVPDPSACGDANGADGADPTGLYNDANTSFNGYPNYDDECREVGEVTHDKSLISATPIGNGQWEVVYGIEVTNKGVEPVGYDLADELHFGEGITVADTEVTSVPDGVTPADPEWDGQDNLTVATGVTIPGTDDADYAPQQYVLTVIADVPLQLADPVDGVDPATCGDAADGAVDSTDRAFNNVSTVTDEVGSVEEDDACAGPPEFAISKSVTDDSPVANGDGTWTVSYEIEVTNTGGLEGEYDVSDRLRFGEGIDVVSSSVQAPAAATTLDTWTGQGAEGDDENLVATDVLLAAGETHSYTITVIVAIDEAAFGSDSLECAAPGSGEAGGLSNVAGLGHNDLTDDADVCVTIEPDVELEKTIASGPVTDDDGGYVITYEIEVTNSGGVPTSYVLSDELRFGEGIEVTGVEVSNEAPGDVPVLGSFTGLGDTGSAENRITGDVPIGIDQVHVYMVEVSGYLDADAATVQSLECADDSASGDGSGLLNVATLDHDGDQLTDDACAPLDTPPGVELPNTGVDGLTVAALIAAVLTLAGGALLVIRGRSRRITQ